MVKVFTSYYGNIKKLNKAGIVPIGISAGTPKFFNGINCLELAPTWAMVKMGRADQYQQYKNAYLDKVTQNSAESTLEYIKSLGEGKSVAILCWETLKTEGEWCHRSMLAEWLTDETGEQILEFGQGKQIRGKVHLDEPQSSLFR